MFAVPLRLPMNFIKTQHRTDLTLGVYIYIYIVSMSEDLDLAWVSMPEDPCPRISTLPEMLFWAYIVTSSWLFTHVSLEDFLVTFSWLLHDFSYVCIWLFRDASYRYISCLLCCRSATFLHRSKKWDALSFIFPSSSAPRPYFFVLSLFAPTLYINILGVAKDLFWRFPGVDLQEDDWRQS